jgi:hypothetical protein
MVRRILDNRSDDGSANCRRRGAVTVADQRYNPEGEIKIKGDRKWRKKLSM